MVPHSPRTHDEESVQHFVKSLRQVLSLARVVQNRHLVTQVLGGVDDVILHAVLMGFVETNCTLGMGLTTMGRETDVVPTEAGMGGTPVLRLIKWKVHYKIMEMEELEILREPKSE